MTDDGLIKRPQPQFFAVLSLCEILCSGSTGHLAKLRTCYSVSLLVDS